jgi:hypothetical protein
MTLSEIETTIGELSVRHPGLNEELLKVLLASAGWEDKVIKDAVVIFKQKAPSLTGSLEIKAPAPPSVQVSVTPPQASIDSQKVSSTDAMVFFQPDGKEEGLLPVFKDDVVKEKSKETIKTGIVFTEPVPQPPVTETKNVSVLAPVEMPIKDREQEAQPILNEQATLAQVQTADFQKNIPQEKATERVVPEVTPPIPSLDPQSLITESSQATQQEPKIVEPPSNLPLLPFESSPHVWSFSKYKDVFHGDSKTQSKAVPERPQVISVMQQAVSNPLPIQDVVSHVPDQEVVVQEVPLKKNDMPLVVLATFMLFVIILILGYMYSNGRL